MLRMLSERVAGTADLEALARQHGIELTVWPLGGPSGTQGGQNPQGPLLSPAPPGALRLNVAPAPSPQVGNLAGECEGAAKAGAMRIGGGPWALCWAWGT